MSPTRDIGRQSALDDYDYSPELEEALREELKKLGWTDADFDELDREIAAQLRMVGCVLTSIVVFTLALITGGLYLLLRRKK